MEKAKEEENMSKEFAAMEEAAMKAYQYSFNSAFNPLATV